MWKCPICQNEEKSKYVCRKCGYDTRKDFVQWRTVSRVPKEGVKECLTLFSDDIDREKEESKTVIAVPKKSTKKWVVGIVALLCLVVLGLTFLGGNEEKENVVTVTNETNHSDMRETENQSEIQETEVDSKKNMLRVWEADSRYVMGTSTKKSWIEEITFLDSQEDMPEEYLWDVSENKDGSVMAWFNEDFDHLYFAANGHIVANPDSIGLFYNYSNVIEINFNQVFDTSQVTDMSAMFGGCRSLKSLDVSGFNTSQVTDMMGMFYGCESLESLDVIYFDTSQVTDMRNMFYECRNLKNLDVSLFDTTQVNDMNHMFYGCENLESLDVGDFDTAQVRNMNSMFRACHRLESLDVSDFDISQVTDMRGMFAGCYSLSPEIYEGIWDGN